LMLNLVSDVARWLSFHNSWHHISNTLATH